MYFYDLEDYYNSRVIGDYNTKYTSDWEDVAGTARATRNAYLKAFNQWYSSSTSCFNEDKLNEIKPYYELLVTETYPYQGPLIIDIYDKFEIFINMKLIILTN